MMNFKVYEEGLANNPQVFIKDNLQEAIGNNNSRYVRYIMILRYLQHKKHVSRLFVLTDTNFQLQ